MTYMGRIGSGDLNAIKSDGSVASFVQSATSGASGCTLVAGTYYFVFGTPDAIISAQAQLTSAHFAWSAAFAATITIETCNFPATIGNLPTGQGGADITDIDTVAGNWIQENPSTALVSVVGASNTATAATVTAGGAAIGGCTFQLGNLATRRARFKLVVTVGGLVRCNVHGKGPA